MPRSRCEVGGHEHLATHLPVALALPCVGGIAKRLLRVAHASALETAQEDGRLEIEVKAAHRRTRETFGPERLQCDLAAHGIKVGVLRIRRIRKKLGLRCKQVKRFKVTTHSKHTLP